ncbi:small ovary isoform X2 [Haematobia irritans]|uniref:small ovary isoform X2 n=1 Tax=Haematobia irritans TaxID=7368 RepID=UPI003F4F7296
MTDAQYDAKFNEMQKYIPFIQKVIEKLKVNNDQQGDNPRKAQLQKMEMLYGLLTNKTKKLKIETLLKCEGVLIKLHAKIEKNEETENPMNNTQMAETSSKAGKPSVQAEKPQEPEKRFDSAPASPSPERLVVDCDSNIQPVVIPTERRKSADICDEDKLPSTSKTSSDHKSRSNDTRSSHHHSHKQRSSVNAKDALQHKSQDNREQRKPHHQEHRNDATQSVQRRPDVDNSHQSSSEHKTPLHSHRIAKDLHTHSAMKHQQQHQQHSQQNARASSKPTTSPSVLQTVKVVITEPLSEDITKRHFPPHHQYRYQQPKNSPPIKDQQRCLHSIDLINSPSNDDAYNPDESWEKYNEAQKNCKNKSGVFHRLGDKVPDDIPQSVGHLQSPPVPIVPTRKTSIPDVLKSPPLSVNDINNLLKESGAEYVPPDISEIGTRRPKKPPSEDLPNSLDIVRKKFAQITKIGSPQMRDSSSPSLETKSVETSGSPASLTSERVALKYNPHPRQERLQSLSSNDGSECSQQSGSRISNNPNDPRLKSKMSVPLPPVGVNVLPCINANDPRLKRQPQLNTVINKNPMAPAANTGQIRNDPRMARQIPQTTEPAIGLSTPQPYITPEENWDTDPEDNSNNPRGVNKGPPAPVTSIIEKRDQPTPMARRKSICQTPDLPPAIKNVFVPNPPRRESEENWDSDTDNNILNKGGDKPLSWETHRQQQGPFRRKSINQLPEELAGPMDRMFIPNVPKHDMTGNWNTTKPDMLCRNSSNFTPFAHPTSHVPFGANPYGNVAPISNSFAPAMDQFSSPTPSYLNSNSSVGNRFNTSLNDSRERMRYFESKKSKQQQQQPQPQTYKEFKESRERTQAMEEANRKAMRAALFKAKRKLEEAEAAKKKAAEEKKKLSELQDKTKPPTTDQKNRDQEKSANATGKTKAGESTLDKMYRTQNFTTQFPKATLSFKIPKKKSEESQGKTEINKPPTNERKPMEKKAALEIAEKKVSAGDPKPVVNKTKETPKTTNNDGKTKKAAGQKSKVIDIAPSIAPNPPKDTEENWDSENETSEQPCAKSDEIVAEKEEEKEKTMTKNDDIVTEKDEKVKTMISEKSTNVRDPRCRPRNIPKPVANDEPEKEIENNNLESLNKSSTENPISNTKRFLDEANTIKFASDAEFKPQKIMRRRCTMVSIGSAPLVDKDKLLQANALMLEDIEEREKLKKRREEEERQTQRRNKHLEEMFQKTDDNCTVSTQNIITGKRRTRASINFNETQNAINVFKHLSKKETANGTPPASSKTTRTTRAKAQKATADELEEIVSKTECKTNKMEEECEDTKEKEEDSNKAPEDDVKFNSGEVEQDKIDDKKATKKPKDEENDSTTKPEQPSKTKPVIPKKGKKLTVKLVSLKNKEITKKPLEQIETKTLEEEESIIKPEATTSSISSTEQCTEASTTPASTTVIADEEHQICAVSSTSTESPGEEPPTTSKALRLVKEDVDDNEPSSSGGSKSSNPTPTPQEDENNRHAFLNEFVQEIIKPNADKQHILSLLGQILSEDKLEIIKSAIESTAKQNVDEDKEAKEDETAKSERKSKNKTPKGSKTTKSHKNDGESEADEEEVDNHHDDDDEDENSGGENSKLSKNLKSGRNTPTIKKKRNELDRLNEDIRDMFICEGVLTATGKRMCTLMNERNKKNDTENSANKKFAQPTALLKTENVGNSKRRSGRLKEANNTTTLPLRRSLRSAKPAEANDEESENAEEMDNKSPETSSSSKVKDTTPTRRKMPVLKPHTPIKLPEELEDDEMPAKDNKRKPPNNKPCPKSKKSKLTKDPLRAYNTDESVTSESDEEPEVEEKQTKSTAMDTIKNTNIHWHNQSKYTSWCMLCNKKILAISCSSHYKLHHGENYISRLAPILVQKFKQGKLSKPLFGVDRTPRQPSWFHRCPFCLQYYNTTMPLWLEHFQNHTAEYRYECSKCHWGSNRMASTRRHISSNCKGATAINSVAKIMGELIKAHVCHLCNFIQIKRASLERHYIEQHMLGHKNVDLLGYTIIIFDHSGVELVPEDKALAREEKAREVIAKEEEVIDIDDDVDETVGEVEEKREPEIHINDVEVNKESQENLNEKEQNDGEKSRISDGKQDITKDKIDNVLRKTPILKEDKDEKQEIANDKAIPLANEKQTKKVLEPESKTKGKTPTPINKKPIPSSMGENVANEAKPVSTLTPPPKAQIAKSSSAKTQPKKPIKSSMQPNDVEKGESNPASENDKLEKKVEPVSKIEETNIMTTPKKFSPSSKDPTSPSTSLTDVTSPSVQIAAKKYTLVLSGEDQCSLKELNKNNMARSYFNCQIISEDNEAKEAQDELLSLAALAAQENNEKTTLPENYDNSRDAQEELLTLAAKVAASSNESPGDTTQINIGFQHNKRKSNDDQMDDIEEDASKRHCPSSNVFVSTTEAENNIRPIKILAQSIVSIDEQDKAPQTSNEPPIVVTSMAERLSQRLKILQENATAPSNNNKNQIEEKEAKEHMEKSSSSQEQNKKHADNSPNNEEITVISDDEEWEDIEITESAPNSTNSHNSSSHLQKNKNKGIFQKFGMFKGNPNKSKKTIPPLVFFSKKKAAKEKVSQPQSNSSSPITIKPVVNTEKTVQRPISPVSNLGFKPVINIMEDLLPDSPCNDPIDLVPELTPLEPLTDLNDISSILDSNLSASGSVGLHMDESHTCIQDALDFISEQAAQEKQASQALKKSGSAQTKNSSTSQIQNVGYSQKDNNVKFYCLLDNCSFLFSSDPMGLENHFLCEHSQIKWKGYCALCQSQCFPHDQDYSISKEIKHMVDKHVNGPTIEHNSDSSQHSSTVGQAGNGEDRPRIKLRRMTGDCLSTSNSESPIPSVASAPASAATSIPPQSNTLLGALLNAKPKPPTIDMPPQPEMPLTEPLLVDTEKFTNVGHDFVITSVESGAKVEDGENSPFQISSVVSLNQHQDSSTLPKISNVCTLSSGKSGNIWSQQIEQERQELLESRAASLEVSNILENASRRKSSRVEREHSRRSREDSPGPIVVAETVPVAQATAGDFLITQTVSTQYGGNSSSASVDFNISIQPSMLSNISISTNTNNESETPLVVAGDRGPPIELVDNTSNLDLHTPLVTSRQYKCMASGCKFTTRVPVAMSDHLRFHERRNLSTKCDYFSCAFCSYQAGDVDDYMKHSERFHIISKTNKPATSASQSGNEATAPISRNICDILSKKMETSNANKNTMGMTEINKNLLNKQKETEEEYENKLRATIDEIVGATGFPDDKLYRCVVKNCRTQLTENTFHSHIMFHISTLGVSNPNNYVFKCPHCSAQYHRPAGIKAHIKSHARSRYFCYLCEETSSNPDKMLKHFSEKHWRTLNMFTKELLKAKVVTNPDGTEQIQDSCYYLVYTSDLSDTDVRKYGEKLILEWQRKKSGSKTHFKSSEIDLLPIPPIYQREVNCGECEYKTKVRTNMYRHLLMHKQNANQPNSTGTMVASVDPVNPVPCLNSNEKFFDKMTNLASSSLIPSTQQSASATKAPYKIPYAFVPEFKRFKCGINSCNYVTVSEDIFRSHLSTLHGEVMTYRCVFCHEDICKRGMSVDRVLGHLRFHGYLLHRCEECNYLHYQRYVVERHVNEKHSTSKVNIVKHERTEEENTDGSMSSSIFTARKYKENTDANQAPTASTSSAPPSTRSSANSDTTSTTSASNAKTKGKWLCDICKYKASSLGQIQNHCQNVHACKLPYQCIHCNFGSQQLSQILYHVDETHPGKTRNARYIYRKISSEEDNDMADTRPLWQRNDPTRIRHIRGILMEDEEESEVHRKNLVADEDDENDAEDLTDNYRRNFIKGFEFGCYHCNYKSQQFDELYSTHYKNVHSLPLESSQPFIFRLMQLVCCPECRKFTGNNHELQLHLSSAHNVRYYYAADISLAESEDNSHRLLCGYCSFHCVRTDHLKKHFRTAKSQHSPQDIRIECDDQITDILELGDSTGTCYQCLQCTQIFGNRVAIVQHAINLHSNDEGFSFKELSNSTIYCCPLCQFYAVEESTLLRHMIDHCGTFKRCYFCNSPQNSFEHCMQHCYAEHREETRRFRDIFTSDQIRQFFMQMFILFPNGLIISKRNLSKTKYGSSKAIDEYYEEMYRISQQPPIPRLSIARLVARKSIEAKHTSANSSPQHLSDTNEEILPTQPKKITKRRCTIISSGHEETNEFSSRSKNGAGTKRKSGSLIGDNMGSLNSPSWEFNVPVGQAMRIKKRRCTISSDPNDKASTSFSSNRSPHPYVPDGDMTTYKQRAKPVDTSFKSISSATTTQRSPQPDLEYFSYYGVKPEPLDLSKIYTKVAIGGINTPLSIDKFRLLFNIDCQLKLTKCDVSNVPAYMQYKHIKKACPASHKLKFS